MILLTADVGCRGELVPPIIGYVDGLLLLLSRLRQHSLIIRMLDDIRDIAMLHGV